jgi:hypothetical protein
MKTNAKASDFLIGAIDHHDWADVCCWHRSAIQAGFSGQVILLCYEHMTEQALGRLRAEGIQIITARSGRGVNEDRFKDVADFAETLDPDDRILMCDVRDVAFQRSIHEVLDGLLEDKPLACASEGVTYGSSAWNLENVRSNFPDLMDIICPMEIFCAGVIAGRAGLFVEFCRAIWSQSIRATSFNGDQIAMNMVMRTSEFAGEMNFQPAHNAMICHYGNMAAATHLSISRHGLLDAVNGPIGVFHQYTRDSKVRFRTLLRHRCLISFYGGKLLSALRRKLGMQPDWIPYWITPVSNTQHA